MARLATVGAQARRAASHATLVLAQWHIRRYIYAMKRTSVFIDEQTLYKLNRAAQQAGVSAASLVREAITAYLASPKTSAVPSIVGAFASGTSDTSERADELLWSNPHE